MGYAERSSQVPGRYPVELKSACCQKIDALLLKKKEAGLKLHGISAASDDTWENLKEGTENAWNEVRSDQHDAIMNTKQVPAGRYRHRSSSHERI